MAIFYRCDACQRELRPEALEACAAETNRFLAEHPEMQNVLSEVFCHVCLPKAVTYWTQKHAVMAEAMDVFKRRLDNFRKQFWAAPKMKAVSSARS